MVEYIIVKNIANLVVGTLTCFVMTKLYFVHKRIHFFFLTCSHNLQVLTMVVE